MRPVCVFSSSCLLLGVVIHDAANQVAAAVRAEDVDLILLDILDHFLRFICHSGVYDVCFVDGKYRLRNKVLGYHVFNFGINWAYSYDRWNLHDGQISNQNKRQWQRWRRL